MTGAPRIRLTPLTPADLDAHLAGEDGQLARWYTAAYLRHCVAQWEVGGPLRAFGTLDLRFAEDLAGEVDVAYGLFPSWRGQGVPPGRCGSPAGTPPQKAPGWR